MLFGNTRLYEQTRKIKTGEAGLPAELDELKRWISGEYSINVINIVYDKLPKKRPSLNVIVETHDDFSKMHKEHRTPNESYQKAISKRFSEIVKDSRLETEYDTNDIWVFYDDFSDEATVRACSQFLEKDKKRLMKKFSDSKIWDIEGFSAWIVVFYDKDSDVEENDRNGTSELIRRECFRLVKQYDEFDYIQFDTFHITFDSKQNLDENYQGNLYYYFH